ncbi:MAG: dihydroneopterin aldolase [Gammaproteobacteria bacterium]
MDIVRIEELILPAVIGIHPWEQHIKQNVIINLAFSCDVVNISQHDNIAYTTDYVELTHFIEAFLKKHHFQLVETLASRLADAIIEQFKLTWLELSVSKPKALKLARAVTVHLERKRNT